MKKKIFNICMLLGVILAILGGIYLPEVMKELSFLGTIYVNLLKFMIIPIIFTSILVTIYESKKLKQGLVLKTVILFICMFIATFLITSLIVGIFKPGIGYNYETVEWAGQITELKVQDIIVNLFPSNIVTMIQNNAVFSTILFAIVFGTAAANIEKSSKIMDVMKELKAILEKIVEYIMYLTPIGVFSLLGGAIATHGALLFDVGVRYILFAYICCIVALILVMIIPACIAAKMSPLTYIKKVKNVWGMTLTTCSSVATLPTTIKTCKNEFDVPEKITDITVPLGCTIHMCGGAVSFALLGFFCCQLFSIDISVSQFLIMIFSSLLINMAAPGIPNGGIVIGATYLSLLGIPLTFIGFYSSIYKLLDMAYTTLNVTGDITANVIINRSETKRISKKVTA